MPTFSPKAIYWGKTLGKFVSVQLGVQVLGFASGILLIRAMDQQQYAYFTIANTMQGTMNMLSDSGISTGLTAIGGKVWQDRYRFGQLINTVIQLKIYLAAISIVIIIPILLWMLISNGASVVYAVFIAVAVLIGLNAQLTIGVLVVVPRLHSQIGRVQNLDLISAISRLVLLCVSYFTFLNAAIASLTASISLVFTRFILSRWVTDSINIKAPINKEDRREILSIIKQQAPNTVFYSVQGQVTVWLITVFGNTQSIAEVGALGRLAVILSIANAVMNGIILPNFARCQSVSLLYRRYWQILGSNSFIAGILLCFTAFFPREILWVLGEKYAHLQDELLLIVASTMVSFISGTVWSLNVSKSWVQDSWFIVPGTVITQILLLRILDVSTVRGVIIFGCFSMFPTLLVNIYMSYKGFKMAL